MPDTPPTDEDRFRRALERLSGGNALTLPRVLDTFQDAELVARMDFAKAVLEQGLDPADADDWMRVRGIYREVGFQSKNAA